MFDPEVKRNNQTLLDSLSSKDSDLQKEAASTLTSYLVIKAREDGIFRKILPPTPVSWDDMTPQVDSLKPVIIREQQPNSTNDAIGLGFGGQPSNTYFGAPRYRIMFQRLQSRRMTADIMNLRGYTMDIRKVFNDLLLKDILEEEDKQFLTAADAVLGAENSTATTRYTSIGAKGYIDLGGAISRSTLALFMEGLPSTNRHLDPATVLVNNITMKQIIALDRAAIGGDWAEDILKKGFSEGGLLGLNWISTIKTNLVAKNIAYQFAKPEALGDFCTLEDVTVATKTENYIFEMFAYETIGGTLANMGAFCKASFSGTARTWV